MSAHRASIRWSLDDHEFTSDTYCRDHIWQYPPTATLAASAASEFLGNSEKTDPEQAFVAAVLAKLHQRAHHECFIANSVTTGIRV